MTSSAGSLFAIDFRVTSVHTRSTAWFSRAPLTIPQGPNQRWSLDFLSDALIDSRRFRILAIVDDFSRECLALVADNSLSGLRVARELDRIVEPRRIRGSRPF